MPAICEECGEEKGYNKVKNFECRVDDEELDLVYEHSICYNCIRKLKRNK